MNALAGLMNASKKPKAAADTGGGGFAKAAQNTAQYEGERNDDGKPEGAGTLKFTNGTVYEGEFRAGVRHGKGTLTFSSGEEYEGEWVDGVMSGHGVGRADREEYEGEWVANQKAGRGKCTFADGTAYDGEWVANKKQGKGKMTFTNGASYDGDWRADVKHGSGRYALANGCVYVGEYADGKRDGKGTFTWASGMVDVCRYKGGDAVGEGARWSSDHQGAPATNSEWYEAKVACRLKDGKVAAPCTLEEAEQIAKRVGLPVPTPVVAPESTGG